MMADSVDADAAALQQVYSQSSYSSYLSFTQGFLLGQASVVLLVFAFLKYFIFGDVRPARRQRGRSNRQGQRQELGRRQSQGDGRKGRALSVGRVGSEGKDSNSDEEYSGDDRQNQTSSTAAEGPATATTAAAASVLRSNRPLSTATLLNKTYHHARNRSRSSLGDADQHHHKRNQKHQDHHPESLDWFNVLVAQTIAQFRADAHSDNVFLVRSLSEALNGGAKPGWMDEIVVTEVSLGENFPIFSDCRVVRGWHAGCDGDRDGDVEHERKARKEKRRRKKARRTLQAHLDVELNDTITLGLETKLILNYPRPLAAALPVSLVVEVTRFRGTLCLSLVSSSPSSPSFVTPSSASHTTTIPVALSNNNTTSTIDPKHSNHRQPEHKSDHNNNNNIKNNNASMPGSSTDPLTSSSSSSSRLRLRSSPSPSNLHLNLTFLPDYTLDLAIRSQLGSRSRLQDVPKIAQLVEQRLLAWFEEKCVEPQGGWRVGVPKLWDSKGSGMG